MSDSFENEFGLASTDPGDASLDLDGDGLSNGDEFLLGTSPIAASDVFLPQVASGAGAALITVPGQEVREGRIYLLEHSEDLGESDDWTVIEWHTPNGDDVGMDYRFEPAGSAGLGFYRVRIEWAR